MRAVSILLLFFSLLAPPLSAAPPHHPMVYREGVHYFLVPDPALVEQESAAKLQVTEFFWYGCSHCFHFEPLVLAWLETLADDVDFVHLPAMWNSDMEAHARLYYAAQRLGVLEQAHQAIYNAINVDGTRLTDPEDAAEFLADFGVEKEAVAEILASPEATAFLKTAHAKARGYQISGTPQLIVAGRYRVQASASLPRSQMFQVVDYLLEKIRAEQAASTEQFSKEKALL